MYALFQPDQIGVTPFLFFTGKGGVGKTSTACATAVQLADQGKKVLIVSTDPASNLADVFEQTIKQHPTKIDEHIELYAINIDPEQAAKKHRETLLAPYVGKLPDDVLRNMEEQLSGGCTMEIAAFDEFTALLTDQQYIAAYDHIIFDTAPTGHTLRLLQLPSAWSEFIETSTHGASCLGPMSGLEKKQETYAQAVIALADPEQTILILVTRPEETSLLEASRASTELAALAIDRQLLIINGVFQTQQIKDQVAQDYQNKQERALEDMPETLKHLPSYRLPLKAHSLTGLLHLRSMFQENELIPSDLIVSEGNLAHDLEPLLDQLEHKKSGVIMTMGKGGVGKTTVAASIALGLLERGHRVHVTTTDPAEHLTHLFHHHKQANQLTISKIDPKVEIEHYRQKVLNESKSTLNEDQLHYLQEDLRSPCTEEIAVFQAFAQIVDQAQDAFVVIDTAPTGHTLLLLDSAQTFHKEVERTASNIPQAVKQLLPRLRNKEETTMLIVTLPEATPYFEAERLQADLMRAQIQPQWWIVNQCLSLTDTTDPILGARAKAERLWLDKIKGISEQCLSLPWQIDPIWSQRKASTAAFETHK